MAEEIERKFLLKDDSWKKEVVSSQLFCQAYIQVPEGKNHTTVRIRIAGEKAFLTLKGAAEAGKFARREFEYMIPEEEAKIMLEEFCGEKKIEKIRYIVPAPPLQWEIDEFMGNNAPLCIAEIELPSEDTLFQRPAWLGDEVTGNHSYSNSFLAQHPFSTWKKA